MPHDDKTTLVQLRATREQVMLPDLRVVCMKYLPQIPGQDIKSFSIPRFACEVTSGAALGVSDTPVNCHHQARHLTKQWLNSKIQTKIQTKFKRLAQTSSTSRFMYIANLARCM